MIATADDAGIVKIIDLQSHRVYKHFRTRHDNIAMCVTFRHKRPWEVLSGGMDSRLIRWDYSRGASIETFDMSDVSMGSQQMINPPFVNSIDISNDGKIIAAGLGSGNIQILIAKSTAGANENKKKNVNSGGRRNKKVTSEWQRIRMYDAHVSPVVCIEFAKFCPNSMKLVANSSISSSPLISGANDGTIILWDVNAIITAIPPKSDRDIISLPSSNTDSSIGDQGNEVSSLSSTLFQKLKFRPNLFTKLNWLCTGDAHFGSEKVFVAGTNDAVTGLIASYNIQ